MMKGYWNRERHRLQVAAQGRGQPIPFTGKNWMKERIRTRYKGDDDVGCHYRIYWEAKNLSKPNNRYKKQMDED